MVIKLQAAFSNPNPHARAEAKLMKLHQGSWTYTKYLTKTLALHADLTLDEEAKIMHFRRGLDPEISRLLLTNLNLPKQFEEFSSLCMQLNNNVQAFKWNQWGEPSYVKKVHLPPQQHQPYRHQYQKDSTALTGKGAYYGQGPMELNANEQWLSVEEKTWQLNTFALSMNNLITSLETAMSYTNSRKTTWTNDCRMGTLGRKPGGRRDLIPLQTTKKPLRKPAAQVTLQLSRTFLLICSTSSQVSQKRSLT